MNLAKLGLAALFFFSSLQAGACKDNDRDWTEERILYDNFSDGGASYNTKWSAPFYGLAGETFFQDGGTLIISFPKGKLKISSREFQWSSDTLFYDHIKYFGTSNQVFPIPQKGSIEFSANIKSRTFKTEPDLKMIAHKTSTGETVEYLLNRAQQAAVTFHMLNFHETGILFD